ncbi:MAG: hypothetical protein QW451_02785 [Candidatus Aenigmatarchaeota archaeon]
MPDEELNEEYEIIPLSPLRRLEKRIEKLEAVSPAVDVKEIFKEVVNVMRMNQEIVSELSKANDAVRFELSKLTTKLEDLTDKLDELISFIKAAASEESLQPVNDTKLLERIGELVETNKKIIEGNESIISILEGIEKKLSRPLPPPSLQLKKPLPQRM